MHRASFPAASCPLFLVLVSGTLAACSEPTDDPNPLTTIREQLTLEEELQQAFEDAACYCEAYIVKGAGINVPAQWVAQVESWDTRLARYAQRPFADRSAGACLSPNAPYDAVKSRVGSTIGPEHLRNGCHLAVPLNASAARPSPGACRADFNYCLAQQLRVKTESLARPPSSRPARQAILREARHRFEQAAIEQVEYLKWADVTAGGACSEPSYRVSGTIFDQLRQSSWQLPAGGQDCHTVCEDVQVPPGSRPPRPRCERVCVARPDASGADAGCAAFQSRVVQEIRDSLPGTEFDGQVTSRRSVRAPGWTATCDVWVTYPTLVVDGCRNDRHVREQKRLNDGYADVAAHRVADSVAQAIELAELETRSLMAAADAVPGTAASYGDAVWGTGGGRGGVWRLMLGERPVSAAAQPGFAGTLARDDRPARALELLGRYKVPLPYSVCTTATGAITAQAWQPTLPAQSAEWAAQAFASLSAAVAAEMRAPVADGERLLASLYAVDAAAVVAALPLARDRTRALDIDFVATPVTAGAGCGRASLEFLTRSVAQHDLRAPAARLRAGTLTASASLPLVPPASALDTLGALDTLRLISTRMHRLMQRNRVRAWANEPGLQRARDLIIQGAGPAWSEWRDCVGCTPRQGTWTTYGHVAADLPSQVVITRDQTTAQCLERGRVPGWSATPACGTEKSATVNLGHLTVDGVAARTFNYVLDQGHGSSDVIWIFSATCSGPPCRRKLLDVAALDTSFDRRQLGGSLGELLHQAMAKDPANPAQPLHTSLGLSNTFIPPLNNPLLDNDSTSQQGFMRLLEDATNAANAVKTELRTLQQNEIELLTAQSRAVIDTDLARQAQTEVVTDACGSASATACRVPRGDFRLRELGIVTEPPPSDTPGPFGEFSGCVDFLRRATFQPPEDDAKDYVGGYLRYLLNCTRWLTQTISANTIVKGVPLAVKDKILVAPATDTGANQATPPDFGTGVGGQVRQLMLQSYQALYDMKVAFRKFNVTFQIASADLEAAVLAIDESDDGWLERLTCKIGHYTVAAAAIVGGVIAIVYSGGAAAPIVAGAASIGGGLPGLFNDGGCDKPDEQIGAYEAFSRSVASVEQMRTLFDTAMNLAGSVASADGHFADLERKANLATQRAQLETRLAQTHVFFDPAWRALQGKFFRDGQDQLLRAQKLGFMARRALEVRIASDLRVIVSDGPLVRAPAGWANDVFIVDEPERLVVDPGGRITRYTQNLRDFVSDYPSIYNFISRNNERAVINVRFLLGLPDSANLFESMLIKCRNSAVPLWGGHAAGQTVTAPCETLGGVDEAMVTFPIPATLSGYFSQRFATGNVNYRIGRFGVNLRGTRLIDCAFAPTPSECQISGELTNYDFRQEGLVNLVNLENQHRTYIMPSRTVRGARALTAGLTLLDLRNDTENRLDPLQRLEWNGRPLSGVYTLTLKSRPEHRWQQLKDIQLLFYYDYWQRQ